MDSQFVKLQHLQLKIPIAIALGLVVCVACGVLVGSANFSTLKHLAFFGVALCYILFWQGQSWKVALMVCLLGFSHTGFGFRIGIIELSSVVAAFVIIITFWRKQRMPRPPVMDLSSFHILNLLLLAWLVYSGCHAVYTVMDPFRPYDFAFKNFAKTIVAMTGPPFLLFYFIHRPRGVVADRRMPISVVAIGLTALIVNILIRSWGIMHGAYNPDLVTDPDDPGYFEVPGLDLVESPYILRSLVLFTSTTAAVLLGSSWLKQRSAGFRGLVYVSLVLSFVGALISGGRASIIFAFVMAGAALWMRGYYRAVLVTVGGAAFILTALNLIPSVLREVPPLLQRSLQMVVFTEVSEYAVSTIDSSSSWRMELVKRSFDEWKSDRRIFWFGRGTYKFGDEDLLARQLNRGEGDMEVSLRRGSTHSLVTDLLVIYGLCGAIIYCAMMISLLWFLWRAYKHPATDEVGGMMTLACLLLLTFLFIYGIVGGASFPIDVAWLLIAVFGYFYGQAEKAPATPGDNPRGALRFDPAPRKSRLPVPALAPKRVRLVSRR